MLNQTTRRQVPVQVLHCRTSIATILVAVLLSLSLPKANADDSTTLGLEGNDEILWIYQRSPEPDGTLLLRFAYRPRDARPPNYFLPLGMTPVTGGVRHAAALGRHLHVIYRDGTHKKYRPSSFVSDPWSSSTQTDERILPESETPFAFAADNEADCLFALVSAKCGIALAMDPVEGEHLPADEPTVIRTRANVPTAATAIARFSEGRWLMDRDGPSGLSIAGASSVLLAHDRVLHLIYTGADGRLFHVVSGPPDASWSAAVPLPIAQPPVTLTGFWHQGGPTLVFAERADEHMQVRAASYTEQGWTIGPFLEMENLAPAQFHHPFGLGAFGADVAVAYRTAEGNPEVGLWSVATGQPSAPAVVVTPLVRRDAPRAPGISGLLIQYVVLAALLTGIFVWRRDSVLLTVPFAQGRQPAPFMKRLAAVLIDLTLLFPVWGPLMFYMVFSASGTPLPLFLMPAAEGASPSAAWFWPVLGGVYAVYGTILEGIFGATLGKRITGLVVIDYRGQRGRFAIVLIRNLARILEFNYPPLALLVLMTPTRQRVGDILAQTVVLSVERADGDPPPPTDELF